jgi:transposase
MSERPRIGLLLGDRNGIGPELVAKLLIRVFKDSGTCSADSSPGEEVGMEEAAELRALARVERDPRQRVRLLALANVREGMPVEEAARATGMGRATLYRWLAREQADGPAALRDRPRSGRRRKLDAAQRAEVRAWVLAGPDLEKDGVVAWRGGDVRAMVERRFKVKLALSSAYRLLDELHLSALVPRPRHGDADPAAQAAFQQTSPHG